MPEPFIIAELAQGYEGKPAQARALLEAAARAGADAAKFQLVYAEELATPDYQHYALFRKLEMADAVWAELAGRARELGIQLQLDIFGPRSLALAQKLGASAVKVHSTDMGNPALLQAIAASAVAEVLLSAAGCHEAEIGRALGVLEGKRIVLLHGFQGYPTAVAANQILRLRELAQYPVRLGFADHADPESELATLLPAAALGAGASVIEKHLTLDRALKLEDSESALNPEEFAVFVKRMRECALALAAGEMHSSEIEYRRKTRKHVVAARALPAGTRLGAADLTLKRSASPAFLQDVDDAIGRRLARAVKADEAIAPAALEPK